MIVEELGLDYGKAKALLLMHGSVKRQWMRTGFSYYSLLNSFIMKAIYFFSFLFVCKLPPRNPCNA